MAAEPLHAGRVAQVEAEDLEPVAPRREVGLGGVACGRVAREPRGHDEVRAGAKQLDAGLVADLDAAAREQGDAAGEIGELAAFLQVELGARRTQLVVEVVDRRVVLLADVAVARLDDLAERRIVFHLVLREPRRRQHVRRREHRLGAQPPDAVSVSTLTLMPVSRRRPMHRLVAVTSEMSPAARMVMPPSADRAAISGSSRPAGCAARSRRELAEDVTGGGDETLAFLVGQGGEQRPVGRHRVEQRRRRLLLAMQACGWRRSRRRRVASSRDSKPSLGH